MNINASYNFLEPHVLYEVGIRSLCLTLNSGAVFEFPETLSNGRANYILFEELVRKLTGLKKTANSDHTGPNNTKFEQKAFFDLELYPSDEYDYFQTSASNTFPANNYGPTIKRFLEAGDYESALSLCKQTGYNHNDFYIYTNSRKYNTSIPFKFFVVPTKVVLSHLSEDDPRLVSRRLLLSDIKSKLVI